MAETRKRWVQDLISRKDAVARALGVPLGALLGCGHWGCVFDSEPPWVVKVTIDPNEAPMWAKLRQIESEQDYGMDGIVRIRGVYRLQPDLDTGKRRLKVHATVREAVEPLITSRGRGVNELSDYTRAFLKDPEATLKSVTPSAFQPRSRSGLPYLTQNLSDTLVGLMKYGEIAAAWHDRGKRSPTEYYRGRRYGSWDEVIEAVERALHRVDGAVGGSLGETLMLLAHERVLLRDVHLGNLGWRVHEEIEGSSANPSLVIFDPGHTPTDKAVEGIEPRYLENARWNAPRP